MEHKVTQFAGFMINCPYVDPDRRYAHLAAQEIELPLIIPMSCCDYAVTYNCLEDIPLASKRCFCGRKNCYIVKWQIEKS